MTLSTSLLPKMSSDSIGQVIITLLILGLLLWALTRFSFIDPDFKMLIKVIAIVGAVVWILKVFYPQFT